jgi:hypothetical protein
MFNITVSAIIQQLNNLPASISVSVLQFSVNNPIPSEDKWSFTMLVGRDKSPL